MKTNKIFLLAAACLFLLASLPGCNPERNPAPYKNNFITKTEYGIYKENSDLLVFSKSEHQLYLNRTDKWMRFISNDATRYTDLTMNSEPEINGNVTVKIVDRGLVTSLPDTELTFEVLKIEDGKCWIWSGSESLGVILMWIEQ